MTNEKQVLNRLIGCRMQDMDHFRQWFALRELLAQLLAFGSVIDKVTAPNSGQNKEFIVIPLAQEEHCEFATKSSLPGTCNSCWMNFYRCRIIKLHRASVLFWCTSFLPCFFMVLAWLFTFLFCFWMISIRSSLSDCNNFNSKALGNLDGSSQYSIGVFPTYIRHIGTNNSKSVSERGTAGVQQNNNNTVGKNNKEFDGNWLTHTLSLIVEFAPFRHNNLKISTWPFSAAKCNGVLFYNQKCTTGLSKYLLTDVKMIEHYLADCCVANTFTKQSQQTDKHTHWSCAFTWAWYFINTSTKSLCPFSTAQCNGVRFCWEIVVVALQFQLVMRRYQRK